jgi:hypothetical protein
MNTPFLRSRIHRRKHEEIEFQGAPWPPGVTVAKVERFIRGDLPTDEAADLEEDLSMDPTLHARVLAARSAFLVDQPANVTRLYRPDFSVADLAAPGMIRAIPSKLAADFSVAARMRPAAATEPSVEMEWEVPELSVKLRVIVRRENGVVFVTVSVPASLGGELLGKCLVVRLRGKEVARAEFKPRLGMTMAAFELRGDQQRPRENESFDSLTIESAKPAG